MSFAALAAVAKVPSPGPSAYLILYICAEYAGPDGSCFPSQTLLSERSGLSERAVRDNLRLLEREGLIRQERRNRKDGTRTSNLIRLLFYRPEQPADVAATVEEAASVQPDELPADIAASHGDNRQVAPVDQRQSTPGLPAADAGLTTFEPVSEPITLPVSKRLLADGFRRFIATFPCQEDRADAEREFAHAVRGGLATIDDLCAGAQRYAIASRGREARWIKKPANWLRGQCWESCEPVSPAPNTPEPDAPKSLPRTGFAGPPALRAAIVADRGEAWAASYLDPCGWDPEQQQLIPRLAFAGDRIRQDAGRILRARGVTIGQPKRAA